MAYDQRLADTERELDELRRIGDAMQSDLSRILEWASQPWDTQEKMPYEVAMSCVEARAAIDEWTEARRVTVAPREPQAPTEETG